MSQILLQLKCARHALARVYHWGKWGGGTRELYKKEGSKHPHFVITSFSISLAMFMNEFLCYISYDHNNLILKKLLVKIYLDKSVPPTVKLLLQQLLQ